MFITKYKTTSQYDPNPHNQATSFYFTSRNTSCFIGATTMDKNNEKNDKFHREVAFLIYTEMVNFRPQS